MSNRSYSRTRGLALSATFAALISVAAPISITLPFTPVPITLQVFIVYLIAMIAGPLYGVLALIIYLLLGAMGLPVYAGISGGLPVLLGPTGGYLFAFPVAAFMGGLVAAKRGSSRRRDVERLAASALVAIGVIYGIGVVGLTISLGVDLGKAIGFGAIPFIPVDLIKAVIAIPIALRIRWSGLSLPITTAASKPVPLAAV